MTEREGSAGIEARLLAQERWLISSHPRGCCCRAPHDSDQHEHPFDNADLGRLDDARALADLRARDAREDDGLDDKLTPRGAGDKSRKDGEPSQALEPTASA